MPRKREIKPSFYADEDLADCSVWARLLFPALWQLADREGRLDDRPAFIRIHAFPYDNLEALGLSVNDMLNELARPRKHCPDGEAFLVRYVVEGRSYIQIRNFKKHQHCHPKEVPSQLPQMPALADCREKVDPSREKVIPSREKVDPSKALSSFPSLSSLPSRTTTDPVASAPAPEPPPFDPPEYEQPLGEITAPVVALVASVPWNREAAELWWHEYKGDPPKAFFGALKPLVKREGWDRVRPALVTYMAETPAEYVNVAGKFVAAFGTWENRARGQPSKRAGGVVAGNTAVLDEWAQEVREGKR